MLSKTYEKQLIDNGFNVVIYANHILRASYLSMNNVAEEILKNGKRTKGPRSFALNAAIKKPMLPLKPNKIGKPQNM